MKKVNDFVIYPLQAQLQQLELLTQAIERYTRTPLQNRIWPLIRQRRLLILTDDPHFATQARFMQKTLCHHLNKELNLKLIAMDIKLIAMPLASFAQKRSRTAMTAPTAQALSSIAEHIQDEGLRQALIRVAAQGQKVTRQTASA